MLYPTPSPYSNTPWPRAYGQPVNRPVFPPVYPAYSRSGSVMGSLNPTQPGLASFPSSPHPGRSSGLPQGSPVNTGLWAGILGGGGLLVGLCWYFLGRATPAKPENSGKSMAPPEAAPATADLKPVVVEKQPALPKIEVSPKFKDPAYCDEIAWKIADDSFPEVLKLVQDFKPGPNERLVDGYYPIHDQRLGQLITRSVQKYLDPHLEAGFSIFYHPERMALPSDNIFSKYGKSSTSGVHSKSGSWHANGQSFLFSSFSVSSSKPVTRRQIQSFYKTYSHEIRHMVQAFAEGPLTPPKDIPRSETDPCKNLYSLLHLSGSYGGDVQTLFKEAYPDCADLLSKNLLYDELTDEQLGRYWKGLNDLWRRTDLPMLKGDPRITGWKKLFEQGEPVRVEDSIDYQVIREMEAYRMCLKRAPSTENKLVESDLRSMTTFLFLRDVLKLYYQVKKTPKAEQHPYVQPEYAQAHPLKLFI